MKQEQILYIVVVVIVTTIIAHFLKRELVRSFPFPSGGDHSDSHLGIL